MRSPADPLSSTFAALSDPTRRAILARLADGEATVSELAKRFGMSAPGISKHLGVLERAGLVVQGQKAQWRPRRLRADPLKDISEWIGRYHEFWDESFDRLDEYLQEVQAGANPILDATPKEPAELVLRVERVCNAPRDLVFRMWTDPGHMAHWWGPLGFDLVECELDARPGGRYRMRIRGCDGLEYTQVGAYQEISDPERLVFTWAWEEEDGRPGHSTRVTVTLAEEGARTRLHLHQAVFDSVERRLGHLAGWRECLAKLADHVETS